MTLFLGDIAPDFVAESQLGTISFHEWKGASWTVFFSHPGDFTPVCTTELGRVAQLKDEWEKRGVKVLAHSVDSVKEHQDWVGDINQYNNTEVTYPILADEDKKIAELYQMIHPCEGDTNSVRSVYIIDPDHKFRTILTYPKSTGRNFDEILRVIDALQTASTNGIATPVDWQAGDQVIVPLGISTDEAKEKFYDVQEHYSYLRTASVRA